MNKLEKIPEKDSQTTPEPAQKGPNLVLLYGLLALGLLVAMGVAAMIVWPFYRRR